MSTDLYFKLALAGFVYIVSPGPVFMSIIDVVSTQSRKAGITFASGAILGDCAWLFLTCLFLIGSASISPLFLKGLSFACGAYLLYIAYCMLAAARSRRTQRGFPKPFAGGFALGMLNPKSYPVLISVWSALILGDSSALTWAGLPVIMLFSTLGFVVGYAVMIGVSGITAFKNFYVSRLRWFSIAFGLVFAGFGIKLLATAL